MIGKKEGAIKESNRFACHRGQIMMEGLLLMVLSLGLLGAALRYLGESRTLDRLTNGAWAGVAQMVEYGNWPGPVPEHPNSEARVRTLTPTN